MKGIKYRSKITKAIKTIISTALADKISLLFDALEEFQQLAIKIPDNEQEKYEKYFSKYFNHELRLLDIEQRKIEMNYREVVFRTDQQSVKFNERLADKSLKRDMREFYHKEYLNILKPKYTIEQVLENFRKYLEVLNFVKEEFNEWFFLGRIDFLKQLLKPYIVSDDSKKKKEIWIYKKFEKKLTPERMQKMYENAGLKLK